MSFYPQTGQGTVSQFPLRRTRHWRAITNQLESGEQFIVPDTAGGQIEWYLRYTDLSDAEAASLNNLFNASFGGYGSFTFIDPLANLLGWSEDFSRPDWQLGLLTQSAGASDPMGTQRASSLANGTTGALELSQSLGISGDYVTCFSVWVYANSAGTITLQRDNSQITSSVGPQWTRVYLSGTGTPGAATSTFSIVIGPGQTVSVFGPQVEAQPFPSIYRQTSGALGIYDQTYFANDDLTVASTAPGLSACSVKLISRV
jgi:hypothetical protein